MKVFVISKNSELSVLAVWDGVSVKRIRKVFPNRGCLVIRLQILIKINKLNFKELNTVKIRVELKILSCRLRKKEAYESSTPRWPKFYKAWRICVQLWTLIISEKPKKARNSIFHSMKESFQRTFPFRFEGQKVKCRLDIMYFSDNWTWLCLKWEGIACIWGSIHPERDVEWAYVCLDTGFLIKIQSLPTRANTNSNTVASINAIVRTTSVICQTRGFWKIMYFWFYHLTVLLKIVFLFWYFSLTKIISNAFEIRLSKIPFHRTFTRSCLLPSFSFQTFFLLIRILIDKNSLLSTT